VRFWDGKEDARILAEQGVEVWAPVHISPERYVVSNLGNVVSNVAHGGQRTMLPIQNTSGRQTVGIYINKGDLKAKSYLVYRLVLYAFDGEPPSPAHTDACHGIGGETDNRLCNLRWGTRSDNARDVLKHKRERVRNREPHAFPQNAPHYEWHDGTEATDILIQRALTAYNDKSITVEGIATILGCTRAEAYGIVKGRTQTGHDLPERAQTNGRNGEQHYRAVCTDAELSEALRLYVENHWSGVQFARHLGIKQVTAHAILSGSNRKNVPRPEGFVYPWPDAATMNNPKGRRRL
jgi:hypothetical protein